MSFLTMGTEEDNLKKDCKQETFPSDSKSMGLYKTKKTQEIVGFKKEEKGIMRRKDPTDIYDIILRERWGSVVELPEDAELASPIRYIVLTWTETESCTTIEECLARMKEIQRSHIKHKGLQDIQHNFCLGGDGNVYEGRGWHHKGPNYPSTLKNANKLKNKYIEAAYIGKSDDDTTELMNKALGKLTAFGTESLLLSGDHKFFAKSETELMLIKLS